MRRKREAGSGKGAIVVGAIAAAVLAGCAATPTGPRIEREATAPPSSPAPPASPAPPRRGGGYYLDDGPGDGPVPDIERIPDAQPRAEPLHRAANNPYVVFGREYVPERSVRVFRQRGLASWYGKRFHGARTSSGEPYDMYAMTAAHPTLAIPSYARVTSLATGRSVVVRINDRGPFLHGRVIDLSYTAAAKLGYVEQGATMVEVEAIVPGSAALASAPAPERVPNASEPRPAEAKPAAPIAPDGVEVPIAAEPGGIYLQLGAFSAPENAENLRARLALELAALDRAIEIFRRDGLYRLHVGPYRSRAEAAAVADQIRGALDVRPHVVVR
jgi:rare lipoprotein A